MRGFLRRIRGLIGTGLTWAVGWAVLWGVPVLIAAGFGALEGLTAGMFLIGALFVAGCGFIAGSAFGMILSVFERKKRLEELSLKRIALMGGLVGGLGGSALVAIFGITLWIPCNQNPESAIHAHHTLSSTFTDSNLDAGTRQ